MLAKTPLRDLMIAWLETQKPDKRYEFADFDECACGQFARAIDCHAEWAALLSRRHYSKASRLGRAQCGRRAVTALAKAGPLVSFCSDCGAWIRDKNAAAQNRPVCVGITAHSAP